MKKMMQAVAVSAALMFAMANASAITTVTLTGGNGQFTGTFGMIHSTGGFTDEYEILPTFPSTLVSSILSTIGFQAGQEISFSKVLLNGVELQLVNNNPGLLAFTPADFPLNGPITLTVIGTSGSNASYSGTMNLTVVPEPEGYALMLAGLGVVGYIGRRKRRQTEAA
jgi:hypothetical protein